MHSNRDLATTTPLSMRHDAVSQYDGDQYDLLGQSPQHAESGRQTRPILVDEEPDEFSPGPSDVNGG